MTKRKLTQCSRIPPFRSGYTNSNFVENSVTEACEFAFCHKFVNKSNQLPPRHPMLRDLFQLLLFTARIVIVDYVFVWAFSFSPR